MMMGNKEIIESIDYAKIFTDLKNDVISSRLRAVRAINNELILLYHRIGNYILKLQKANGWEVKLFNN